MKEGKSKYVLLGMLARMPLTGYSMRKWIESEYSYFWQASYGQIYPTLKELVAEGLAVCSTDAETANGRGQIEYAITDAGRQVLADWLRQEPEIEKIRYEILLKISFGEQTEPEVLLKHLDDFIRRNEKLAQETGGFVARLTDLEAQGQACTYSRLTAMCGVSLYTAMRDWAVEAKKIIRQKEADVQ